MRAAEKSKFEDVINKNRTAYIGFANNVSSFFASTNTNLIGTSGHSVVHSVRYREKDFDSLIKKIDRKRKEGRDITPQNVLSQIHDFMGVRVLHLRPQDFALIHNTILRYAHDGHWYLAEPPKAYTWDPEYNASFTGIGLKTELKESFYTSVHYVVKPNKDTVTCCEIQVRSLFEEIWAEIDHQLNYPTRSTSKTCQEQLKVLAKLVGAGSRLVDSIVNSAI